MGLILFPKHTHQEDLLNNPYLKYQDTELRNITMPGKGFSSQIKKMSKKPLKYNAEEVERAHKKVHYILFSLIFLSLSFHSTSFLLNSQRFVGFFQLARPTSSQLIYVCLFQAN